MSEQLFKLSCLWGAHFGNIVSCCLYTCRISKWGDSPGVGTGLKGEVTEYLPVASQSFVNIMVSHAKQSVGGTFGTAVAKENSYEIGSAAWCLGWLNNINNRGSSIQVICDNIKSGTALASSLTSQSQELDGMQEHHSLDSFWLPCARDPG
jgi:hypothetical protein